MARFLVLKTGSNPPAYLIARNKPRFTADPDRATVFEDRKILTLEDQAPVDSKEAALRAIRSIAIPCELATLL